MTDIVERLRHKDALYQTPAILDGAADEIERLRAEVAALTALLPMLFAQGYAAGHHGTVEGTYTHVLPVDMPTYFAGRQEVIDAARAAKEDK